MRKFVIISYYTKGTPYEGVYTEYLGKSLKRFSSLDHCVYVMENQGSWLKNVAIKPEVIEIAMHSYEQHNVIFLDADATIEKYPKLFWYIPKKYDMAAHFLNWNTWYGYKSTPAKLELLSGTMFFRNTDKVRALVRKWKIDAQMHGGGVWEQKLLQVIIKKEQGAHKIYELPVEYCYIKTLPGGQEPLVKATPVILHHQVSRKLKHLIT